MIHKGGRYLLQQNVCCVRFPTLVQDMAEQMFFKVDKPISGDIVFALYMGNYKTNWELPLLAYALHTAFLKGDDVVHADAKKVDFPYNPAAAATISDGFHLDVMMEELPAAPGCTPSPSAWVST